MPNFLARVRASEETLFPDLLDPEDASRMRNDGAYSWLYRPSHHAETGLIKESDIAKLHNGELLSIGAYPAALERVLIALGVPAPHITVADVLPEILNVEGGMRKLSFDVTGVWPETGLFDLILFPESLCIALTDKLKHLTSRSERDAAEAKMLGHIVKEALRRLKPGGEIRANGPMSHPNVVKTMSAQLHAEGGAHTVHYARYFMTIEGGSPTGRASGSSGQPSQGQHRAA